MKNLTVILILAIFAISVAPILVDGVDVKYTFDENAVAAKNAADSAALAKEVAQAYIKITTTPTAYNKIGDLTAPPGETFLVVDVIIEDHGYPDFAFGRRDFDVCLDMSSMYQPEEYGVDLMPIGRLEMNEFSNISSGEIIKGSVVFLVPNVIKNYEFGWDVTPGLTTEYNTTIDGKTFDSRTFFSQT